ncbi:hypothetical protein ABVC73_01700 [Prevotella melaninogenica]
MTAYIKETQEYKTLQLGESYTGDNPAIIAATTPITLKLVRLEEWFMVDCSI